MTVSKETFNTYFDQCHYSVDDLFFIAESNTIPDLSDNDLALVNAIKSAIALNEAVMAPAKTIKPPRDTFGKRLNVTAQKQKEYGKKVRAIGIGPRVTPGAITPGFFYHFKYSSIMYDNGDIDFFEKNPLILCIPNDSNNKLILGMNFHYISPRDRLGYWNKFAKTFGASWSSETDQINMDWDQCKSFFGVNAERMIHAYIPNRIRDCYAVNRTKLQQMFTTDTSNFSPEVTKSVVWSGSSSDIIGNKFNIY